MEPSARDSGLSMVCHAGQGGPEASVILNVATDSHARQFSASEARLELAKRELMKIWNAVGYRVTCLRGLL